MYNKKAKHNCLTFYYYIFSATIFCRFTFTRKVLQPPQRKAYHGEENINWKVKISIKRKDRQDGCSYRFRLAERAGFEPAVRVSVRTLSKRVPSTTQPSLHGGSLLFRCRLFPTAVYSTITADKLQLFSGDTTIIFWRCIARRIFSARRFAMSKRRNI